MFDPILFSLPVKRSVTISNEHCVYESPHKLPNDIKSRILGIRKNHGNLKISKKYSLEPSLSPKMKNFLITSRKLVDNKT